MKLIKNLRIVGAICFTLTVGLGFSQAVGAQSYQAHTVQPGDTMWNIAQTYQVDFNQLIRVNAQVANTSVIYPGQQIIIPNTHAVAYSEQQFENRVVELTNAERAKYGLRPLEINWELARVAGLKSQDMIEKNYFDHHSPTYGSPFDMMTNFGINYSYAGENIAAGQRTPEEVVQAWMDSPGHRANILNGNFTEIGVGFVKGGSYQFYWTQMFI